MNAPAAIAARPILTRSQRQVLDLAVLGHTGEEIGRALGITGPAAVQTLYRARARVGARSLPHRCALAVAYGLVDAAAIVAHKEAGRRLGLTLVPRRGCRGGT